MPIKVHENRIPLYVGIADTIIFLLALIFSTTAGLQDNDMTIIIVCAPIFGGFVLLGIYLLLVYFRHHLLFDEYKITIFPCLGKPKTVRYQDISYIIFNTSELGVTYRLYDYQDRNICKFDANMINAPEALAYLQEKNVLIRPLNVQDKGGWPLKISLRTTNMKAEINDFIKARYKKAHIKKERKFLKVVNYGLLILCLISYLLEGKMLLIGYMSVLLICWILYIYFFPRMLVESQNSIKKSSWFIGFPIIPCAIAIFLLFIPESNINMDWNIQLQFTFLAMIVLLIPFFIVIWMRKCKIYLTRILCIVASALLFAYISTPIINYCTETKQNGHDLVLVKSKYISTSKYRDTYYIVVEWQGEKQDIKVSRQVYKTINIYGTAEICKRESIFHVPFWTIHK